MGGLLRPVIINTRFKKSDVKLFKAVYYSSKKPGSFSGKGSFLRAIKQKTKNKETIKNANLWLSSIDAYTLHKPLVSKFQRRKTIVAGIDACWQLDLTNLNEESTSANKDHKYILFCIDVFSKYLWTAFLKNKRPVSIIHALSEIFKSTKRRPKSIMTDKGGEFVNKKFQEYLQKNRIHFYTSQDDKTKASVVERVQRTIKQKVARYLTHRNTLSFIDSFDNFVQSYNSTPHRSTKTPPNKVSTSNQEQIWHTLYLKDQPISSKQYNGISKGDIVEISTSKLQFDKGYEQKWTIENFVVSKIQNSIPTTYKLTDLLQEPIKGSFYGNELQKVNPNQTTYQIETVLGERKIAGKKQYLVKWKGYPSKFNSYVTANDIRQLK